MASKQREPASTAQDRTLDYSLLLNVPASVAILEGPDHTFRFTNPSYIELVNNRDLIGRTVREAFPELAEQGYYELLDDVYDNLKPFVGKETPAVLVDSKTGRKREIFVDFTYNPILGHDGKATGIFVHATDVTETVLNRAEINAARRRYKMVLNSVDEGFCIIDVIFDKKGTPIDYRFIEANGNFEEQTGLKDPIGKTAKELIPSLEQHWFDTYGGVAKTGKAVRFSQGSAVMGRWFDVQATKVDGDSGNLVALLFKDVSEAHLAQLELLRVNQRYDALFNSNTVALCVADFDGNISEANDSFFNLYGLTSEDVKSGLNARSITAPSDVNGKKMYQDIRTKGEAGPIERRYVHKDGTEFPALVGSVRLNLDEEKFVAFIIDRSETEQLKELNRTKDEFIALASHQLRTPATAVKQYLGIVTDEYAGPITPDQLQYLNIAANANDRQLMIIEDLLKTARIDTRGFGLTLVPQDFVALIRDTIRQYRPMAGTKSQTLSFSSPKELIVPFDKTEISVCVANLLENALKYSPINSVVDIVLTATKTHAELSVTDHGVGIESKDLDKIFDKFTRIHNELSDTTSGSGLGLYWVKRIIDIHKGTLTIDSELGKGTTFTIRLKK